MRKRKSEPKKAPLEPHRCLLYLPNREGQNRGGDYFARRDRVRPKSK